MSPESSLLRQLLKTPVPTQEEQLKTLQEAIATKERLVAENKRRAAALLKDLEFSNSSRVARVEIIGTKRNV